MPLVYILKSFQELSVDELYAILQLRNEVFAVEQNCVYGDMDNKDQGSLHLMGWEERKLLSYARLLPPGLSYKEPSIGRVVTSPAIRGGGEGKKLMQLSIDHIKRMYEGQPIRISAQFYLIRFYTALGFVSCSEVYIEDHIEHIEMLLG
jgi:ElaA protein